MMANVSELSIAQATALKLQEEVKSKELLLEQAYSRMEKVYFSDLLSLLDKLYS